jgi:outer membrane protein TolC
MSAERKPKGLGTRAARMGLMAVALGLAGGCAVDQAREVRTYRKVLDANDSRPEPLKPGETLTLARALALANADNEQIASQGETYLQALIAKNRAFAAFLPTVSFQPNFTVEEAPRGNAPASPGAPPTSAASVAATQGGFVQDRGVLRRLQAPVVGAMNFSFRNVPIYKAAEIAVYQQRQLLLDARATVLLNVAQTYFQVVISTQQVAVLEHSLALQQARLVDLEGRLNAKLALPLEVAQARSEEASARVLLSRASNDLRNGRRTLALLIGAQDVDGPLVSSIPTPDPEAPMASYVERALAHRQDLLAAQAAVREARYSVQAAIAEYYPSASLNVVGYLYEQNYANASKWNAILSANLPLFTGGAIRADVRDAWSKLRQAALFESYLSRQIEQGVRTAYDNMSTSEVVLGQLLQEVEASLDAYRQSVELEKNGLAIPLDVLSAQDTLLNAQLQYANESYSRAIFQLDLIRAVGELDPSTPASLHWAEPAPPPQGN